MSDTQKESYSYEYKTLTTFGPKLGVIKLNDFIVDKMITLTDEILSDDNRISNGHKLAGQIEEEPVISMELLKKYNLYNFFNSTIKQYLAQILDPEKVKNQLNTGITEMWIVSQYENEYNPIHWHEGCTMSAVMYLKIPEYIPRNLKGKHERDGEIIFINNNHNSPFHSLENPISSFKPEVGDMFIFPSRLLHGVYPFKGDGERRSVSFNGIHMPVEQLLNNKTITI